MVTETLQNRDFNPDIMILHKNQSKKSAYTGVCIRKNLKKLEIQRFHLISLKKSFGVTLSPLRIFKKIAIVKLSPVFADFSNL